MDLVCMQVKIPLADLCEILQYHGIDCSPASSPKTEMLSSSPLVPSVPSATLLRFLRSQSRIIHVLAVPTGGGVTARALGQPRCSPPSAFSGKYSARAHMSSGPSYDALPSSLCNAKKPTLKRTLGLTRLHSSMHDRSFRKLQILPLQTCRASSTRSRPLLRQFLDWKRGTAAAKAEAIFRKHASPGFDDGVEGNAFNIGRNLAAKASNEPRLRCTEFDINGNVTLVNGEFRKSELIAKVRSFLASPSADGKMVR